jgi:hypothetical protein
MSEGDLLWVSRISLIRTIRTKIKVRAKAKQRERITILVQPPPSMYRPESTLRHGYQELSLIDRVNRTSRKIPATRRSGRLTARDLVGQIGILVCNNFGEDPRPQKPAS